MAIVVFINGLLLLGLGVLMAFDALIFPATRVIFLEAALITLSIGGGVCVSAMGRGPGLDRRH